MESNGYNTKEMREINISSHLLRTAEIEMEKEGVLNKMAHSCKKKKLRAIAVKVLYLAIAFIFFVEQIAWAGGQPLTPSLKDKQILPPSDAYATFQEIEQAKQKQQEYIKKINGKEDENLTYRYNLDGSFTVTDKKKCAVFLFGKNEKILSITDIRIGRVTKFNPEGRVSRIIEANGTSSEYLYDKEGVLIEIIEKGISSEGLESDLSSQEDIYEMPPVDLPMTGRPELVEITFPGDKVVMEAELGGVDDPGLPYEFHELPNPRPVVLPQPVLPEGVTIEEHSIVFEPEEATITEEDKSFTPVVSKEIITEKVKAKSMLLSPSIISFASLKKIPEETIPGDVFEEEYDMIKVMPVEEEISEPLFNKQPASRPELVEITVPGDIEAEQRIIPMPPPAGADGAMISREELKAKIESGEEYNYQYSFNVFGDMRDFSNNLLESITDLNIINNLLHEQSLLFDSFGLY
ncbi:MAG: hypothetical protein ABH844_02190 [Candidatus Omnitrophota bacterium]